MKLIFKTLAAMMCTLVLWEMILENTVEKNPGSTTHPILGRISKAGITVQGGEGFSRTRINQLGMREENILPEKGNEYRILILGDSFTKGVQVADDKLYSYLLQKSLKNKYNLNIRTINAGRDGASPAFYIYLSSFYKSFKPDFTIVQLRNGNIGDMLDTKKQFYISTQKDTFKTVHNQDILSDDPLSQIFLHKFPRLAFLLEYSVLRIGGKNLQKVLSAKSNKVNAAESSTPLQSANSFNDAAVVDWTVRTLKSEYPKLLLFYIPDINYFNLKETPSEVETLLTQTSYKQKVNFINVREDFVRYYRAHYQPAYGFNNTTPGKGHINEIGHELIAERLASFFDKERLK